MRRTLFVSRYYKCVALYEWYFCYDTFLKVCDLLIQIYSVIKKYVFFWQIPHLWIYHGRSDAEILLMNSSFYISCQIKMGIRVLNVWILRWSSQRKRRRWKRPALTRRISIMNNSQGVRTNKSTARPFKKYWFFFCTITYRSLAHAVVKEMQR